jgi:hypothetical protein
MAAQMFDRDFDNQMQGVMRASTSSAASITKWYRSWRTPWPITVLGLSI